jgi:hypothetical protein
VITADTLLVRNDALVVAPIGADVGLGGGGSCPFTRNAIVRGSPDHRIRSGDLGAGDWSQVASPRQTPV